MIVTYTSMDEFDRITAGLTVYSRFRVSEFDGIEHLLVMGFPENVLIAPFESKPAIEAKRKVNETPQT